MQPYANQTAEVNAVASISQAGGSLGNLGIVGNRRDLFKMQGIVNKMTTQPNLPKKPTSLARVARAYEKSGSNLSKNNNIFHEPNHLPV